MSGVECAICEDQDAEQKCTCCDIAVCELCSVCIDGQVYCGRFCFDAMTAYFARRQQGQKGEGDAVLAGDPGDGAGGGG